MRVMMGMWRCNELFAPWPVIWKLLNGWFDDIWLERKDKQALFKRVPVFEKEGQAGSYVAPYLGRYCRYCSLMIQRL
jgi:hypothetical protein